MLFNYFVFLVESFTTMPSSADATKLSKKSKSISKKPTAAPRKKAQTRKKKATQVINEESSGDDVGESSPSTIQNQSSSLPGDTSTTSNLTLDIDMMPSSETPVVDTDTESADDRTNVSSVWSYASKLSNDKAQCNKCKRILSCKDHSTSSVRKHLVMCSNLLQFTSTKRKRSSLITPEKLKHYRQLAIKCIIMDGRGFSDLHKPGMASFLQEVLPGQLFLLCRIVLGCMVVNCVSMSNNES